MYQIKRQEYRPGITQGFRKEKPETYYRETGTEDTGTDPWKIN